MHNEFLSREDFLQLSNGEVAELLTPYQLSISLLINGTRRAYIAEHFDTPPTDQDYLRAYLEDSFNNVARILGMLADHGVRRIFIPTYSEEQTTGRNDDALKILLKGIQGLAHHPALQQIYQSYGYEIRFYGDISYLPPEVCEKIEHPPQYYEGEAQRVVYYGIDGGNPHEYILKLAYMYVMAEQRPPTWRDMVKMYYGRDDIEPLNILVAFNRIYARLGIPPLLDGKDRIYATPVSPIKMTQKALRDILYDYVFNTQDPSRSYVDMHPDEVRRLKQFYSINQDTVIGLTKRYDDLVYPLPTLNWPSDMNS